jgi:hypothetical protein
MASDDLQNNVCGDVVTERGGKAEKLLQRDFDVRIWIFVLQRAVGFGKDAIAEEKMNRLVERKSTLFDEMESSHREREFEHGLHGWMCVGIEIAIEGRVRNRAGYGNFAMRVSGDSADLLLEVGLSADGK